MDRIYKVFVASGDTLVLSDLDRCLVVDGNQSRTIQLDTQEVAHVANERYLLAGVRGGSVLSLSRGEGDHFETFRGEAGKSNWVVSNKGDLAHARPAKTAEHVAYEQDRDKMLKEGYAQTRLARRDYTGIKLVSFLHVKSRESIEKGQS